MADDWRESAACRQAEDKSIFFPERGDSVGPARMWCNGCPVRQECLDYALEMNERHGIWGGSSEMDRRRMRKGRKPRSLVGIGHGKLARYNDGCRCDDCVAQADLYGIRWSRRSAPSASI